MFVSSPFLPIKFASHSKSTLRIHYVLLLLVFSEGWGLRAYPVKSVVPNHRVRLLSVHLQTTNSVLLSCLYTTCCAQLHLWVVRLILFDVEGKNHLQNYTDYIRRSFVCNNNIKLACRNDVDLISKGWLELPWLQRRRMNWQKLRRSYHTKSSLIWCQRSWIILTTCDVE